MVLRIFFFFIFFVSFAMKEPYVMAFFGTLFIANELIDVHVELIDIRTLIKSRKA